MRVIFKRKDDEVFIKEVDELEVFELKGKVVIPLVFKGNPCEVRLNTNIDEFIKSVKHLEVLDLTELETKYNNDTPANSTKDLLSWFKVIGDMGNRYLVDNFTAFYNTLQSVLLELDNTAAISYLSRYFTDYAISSIKESVIDYCAKAIYNGEICTFKIFYGSKCPSVEVIQDLPWNDVTKTIKFRYWYKSLNCECKEKLIELSNTLTFLNDTSLSIEQIDEILCTYSSDKLLEFIKSVDDLICE